jgi:hypothetical protein
MITKSSTIALDHQEGKWKKTMEHQDLSRDEGIMMTYLDPLANIEEQRPQLGGDQTLVQIGLDESQTVKVGG